MSISARSPNDNVTLTVRNVSKYYGKVAALNDVSFELKKGEFLTMLGPSGSGKTTTLRVIAGFLRPDAGSVVIEGKDVVNVPPNRRNIGMVFQDYALFPHMTIAANVGFPLETRGIPVAERRQKVSRMLEVVGLSNFENRYPKQLSGGQQQRVALARALIFDPEIVLLDEPMAALDKKLRANMQLEIMKIAKQVGATVISVTHDQEEALVMSDRIVLFNHGALVQIGTPVDLYQHPNSEFVADFIGEANILKGQVTDCTDTVTIKGDGWVCKVPTTAVPDNSTLSEVKIVLRPEALQICSEKLPTNGNIASGNLTDKIYLGVEFKLLVDVGQSQKIQVRSRQLKDISKLAVGDQVQLTWNTDDVVVLN